MGILDQYNQAEEGTKDIIVKAIKEEKTIKISYRKFNGEISKRNLSNLDFNNSFKEEGFNNDHIRGFCHLRKADRTFKIDRILSVKIID